MEKNNNTDFAIICASKTLLFHLYLLFLLFVIGI
jgi:hypothetical protein